MQFSRIHDNLPSSRSHQTEMKFVLLYIAFGDTFDFRPLGLAIREARERAGLSCNDLGDKVFYGERHIADIENTGSHPSFQLYHVQYIGCDTILIISQEALFCYPHRFRLLHSPQHIWGISPFIYNIWNTYSCF